MREMIGYLTRHDTFFETIFEEKIEGKSGKDRPRCSYVGLAKVNGVASYQKVKEMVHEKEMEDTPPTSV